jgi:hypothetical protein
MATRKKKDETLEEFDTGALRENKAGKGRSDLMANAILQDVLAYAMMNYFGKENCINVSSYGTYIALHSEQYPDMYYQTIISITCMRYADPIKSQNDHGIICYVINAEGFVKGMAEMSLELAKHYENGAVKHGIDNWKKGIPVIGGERGGSCNDSARRHGDKYLAGYDDEDHAISCIWNCVTALWMLKEKKEKNDK